MTVYRLVLVRHGESQWNQENRFTGWVDVDLSEKGVQEARQAGQLLKEEGLIFDVAYTSILKRAIRTLWLALEEMEAMWIPIKTSWRLNERHYGALQGLNKAETATKYGEDQVKIWRRSYDVLPPPLNAEEIEKQKQQKHMRALTPADIPNGESLKTTLARLLPLWDEELVPKLKQGEKLLIVAHGNSIRALVQHLEKLTPEQIMEINIPTGVPLVYDLDPQMKVVNKRYLGDATAITKAQAAVASQGQKQANK